jgi:3',5'-cyclic AMP phosphodiesterase CpdA
MWRGISSDTPDFLIIAGDITNTGSREQFAHVRTEIEHNLLQLPVFSAMGNHDVIDSLTNQAVDHEARAEFIAWTKEHAEILSDCGSYYAATVSNLAVIVLDSSHEDGKYYLGIEQRDWLKHILTESKSRKIR